MSSSAEDSDAPSLRSDKVRRFNVYDAVAGRANVYDDSVLTGDEHSSKKRRDSISADVILAPEEVLFRRTNAPVRYAEADIYWTNEDLPDGGRDVLPSSDLLKSIHNYTSRYYAALNMRLGREDNLDVRSMDETALLAFGILLEEAARETLGKDGDLVFTEGEDADQRKPRQIVRPRPGKGKEAAGKEADAGNTDGTDQESSRARKRTKRSKSKDKAGKGAEGGKTDDSGRESSRAPRTKKSKAKDV